MLARTLNRAFQKPLTVIHRRAISTLQGNPHIVVHPYKHTYPLANIHLQYVFQDKRSLTTHILSLLPTSPPTTSLAIGTTTQLPPTPDSFTENHNFLSILQSVVAEHAHRDPDVISQAQALASSSGSNLGSGGVFFPQQQRHRRGTGYGGGGGAGGDGAGGASSQGGAGSGGRGGWVHVSDQRNPPDYGRTAWPEDIFGSVEVDGKGEFVGDKGEYQPSGRWTLV
ncbi:MAG: hypothetical protein M1830_000161 [Pleopsidium flavum]|nr:MAG: hypothetical protein M1830_000161 [Pleopsidium flavum]